LPGSYLSTGKQAAVDEVLQAAGEDVGCDTLLGVGQQFTEVASVSEDDVAQD